MTLKTLILLGAAALLLAACAGGRPGLSLDLDLDLGGGDTPRPDATPGMPPPPENGLDQYALAITVLVTLVLLALLAGIVLGRGG
jgi:hypothetical protein